MQRRELPQVHGVHAGAVLHTETGRISMGMTPTPTMCTVLLEPDKVTDTFTSSTQALTPYPWRVRQHRAAVTAAPSSHGCNQRRGVAALTETTTTTPSGVLQHRDTPTQASTLLSEL